MDRNEMIDEVMKYREKVRKLEAENKELKENFEIAKNTIQVLIYKTRIMNTRHGYSGDRSE